MKKKKIGLVTARGECGMGNVAQNWIYTIAQTVRIGSNLKKSKLAYKKNKAREKSVEEKSAEKILN